MSSDKIIIHILEENIINGILFYCIEHYLYLSKNTNIELCVIFKGDIDNIKNIISNKYIINEQELNNIRHITPLDLLKEDTAKALILDTSTYNIIKLFTKKINKLFLYSNDNNHDVEENVYGFYDYQKYNIKERLKLGFQFMKPKIPHLDKAFCSCLLDGVRDIDKKLIENSSNYDIVYKDFKKDLDIIAFKDIIYYHTKFLDRNNRIIPESFYFGNNITVLNSEGTNDSVNERYLACTEDVTIFQIDETYKLTKDFLEG